jgi:hypothetical protein
MTDLALRILAAETAVGKLTLRSLEAEGPTMTLARDEVQEFCEQMVYLLLVAREMHHRQTAAASGAPRPA